jgi:hypothetical protein
MDAFMMDDYNWIFKVMKTIPKPICFTNITPPVTCTPTEPIDNPWFHYTK